VSDERPYIDANTRQRGRLRALVEALDDAALTAPVIHAIAPREAARLALRTAEETDALAARLPLDRLWPGDPDSPISPARGEHRGEHLDEIEAALRTRS
jgi:hypothetical protein